jgi:hypothetical protein
VDLQTEQRRSRFRDIAASAIGAAIAVALMNVAAERSSEAPTSSTEATSPGRRSVPAPLHDKLPVGHRFAVGSDAELRENFAFFLVILDAYGGDHLLWSGFVRLGRMAAAGTSSRDRSLARRLLASARRTPPPPFVAEWLPVLHERANRP